MKGKISTRKSPKKTKGFTILPQPTETTCGPTCLHAVYSHLGHDYSLEKLIGEVREAPSGGTYSVMLAHHALKQGFSATIYSYNLRVFDPTWKELSPKTIIKKLSKRLAKAKSLRAKANLKAYIDFLKKGGSIRFDELTPSRLRRILSKDGPIIAGLSSTYLYRDSRYNRKGKPDDVYGEPEGHFVVITDWHAKKEEFEVADPYHSNPMSSNLNYRVDPHRLINSILLGIVTYDANLLVIEAPSNR